MTTFSTALLCRGSGKQIFIISSTESEVHPTMGLEWSVMMITMVFVVAAVAEPFGPQRFVDIYL